MLGVCDSQNGNCVAQQLSNGDDCDDFDWCTDGETCQNGQCVGGQPVDICQDGDNCCPGNCSDQNDADCLLLGVLYFSQDSNANGLFRLDPVTGMATAVGASGVTGGTSGLAPHPQQNQLFVSQPFGLLTAMRNGSGATGPVGSTGMEGLAYCSSNNQLYAGINGSFFLVDQATGANAGALAAPGFDAEGIACKQSTGTIYAIGGSSSSLHAYSIGSNTWSVVGSIGTGWDNAGLAYDPGSDTLYAMANGKGQTLYAINPQNASVITVGATGISGTANGGLAFALGPHP